MAVIARLHNRASSFRQRFDVAYLAIHPSSTTSPFPGLWGCWSISQPPPGERCSTSRTSRQHITGLKYKDRQLFTFTFIPRVNSESPILLSYPQCISLGREGGGWGQVPATQTQGDHAPPETFLVPRCTTDPAPRNNSFFFCDEGQTRTSLSSLEGSRCIPIPLATTTTRMYCKWSMHKCHWPQRQIAKSHYFQFSSPQFNWWLPFISIFNARLRLLAEFPWTKSAEMCEEKQIDSYWL